VLESLRKKNKKGVILLLIDNFSSQISNLVKQCANELKIELCFLPKYSPELQPEEKIWHDIKRLISSFKVDCIENYQNLKVNDLECILRNLIENPFMILFYIKISGIKFLIIILNQL
jgi:transposase